MIKKTINVVVKLGLTCAALFLIHYVISAIVETRCILRGGGSACWAADVQSKPVPWKRKARREWHV